MSVERDFSDRRRRPPPPRREAAAPARGQRGGPALRPPRPRRPGPGDAIVVSILFVLSAGALGGCIWYFLTAATLPPLLSALYAALFAGLAFCTLSYELARLGAALRLPWGAARPFAEPAQPPRGAVTVLIPAYKEEPRVIRHTLLSAVLARHPDKRIAVLIDDPPEDEGSVASSLAAVEEVREIFRQPLAVIDGEYAQWKWRLRSRSVNLGYELDRLSSFYGNLSAWLTELGAFLDRQAEPEFAHVDGFLTGTVLAELSRYYQGRADAVQEECRDLERVDAEYEALRGLFCRDVTAFQRKRFANLPHDRNKAMNLNAYIALLGGFYATRETGDGRLVLEPAAPDEASLHVPAADFVLTLDADSLIKSDYIALLLAHMHARPRAAVVQTPYLAFPHAPSYLERVAGATTDVQFIYHQGSTAFGGSFWVGANALLRVEALHDIARSGERAGVPCTVFIQDDTVIEDTGSTIDLLRKGWHVFNHPEALAYSATPADFGALSIQRRRWSNGGLIIAPRFFAQYLKTRGRLRRLGELLLRSNYLLSSLVGNLCIFVMMALLDGSAGVLLVTSLAMLPYFLLYARDLRRLGYRYWDLAGVCALNLLLMPVVFGGILDSLRQAATRRPGQFVRTPKIGARTLMRPSYIVFNLGMTGLMVYYMADAIREMDVRGAIVPGVNLLLYLFGLLAFMGPVAIAKDLFQAVGLLLRRRS